MLSASTHAEQQNQYPGEMEMKLPSGRKAGSQPGVFLQAHLVIWDIFPLKLFSSIFIRAVTERAWPKDLAGGFPVAAPRPSFYMVLYFVTAIIVLSPASTCHKSAQSSS